MTVTGETIRVKAIMSELNQTPTVKTPGSAGGVFAVGGFSYEVIEIVEQDNVFVTCAVKDIT
jgi:hypothetical protein